MTGHRSMTRLARLAVAAVIGGCPAVVVGQHYHIRSYTETRGLPSYTVRSIVQTRDGTMWFGTRAGVVSYDGARWQVYQGQAGLPAGGALLTLDHEGTLWAVAHVAPLCAWRLVGGTWKKYSDMAGGEGDVRVLAVQHLPQHVPGTLLARTDAGRLYVLEGKTWHAVDFESTISSPIRAVVRLREDVFIVTSRQVLRWHGRAIPPEVILEVASNELLGAAEDAVASKLWLIGRHGIGHISNGEFEIVQPFEVRVPGVQLDFSALCTLNGRLYFGESSRLYMWLPGEPVRTLGMNNGLVSDGTLSLFEDREGVVWIGSYRGLSKLINHRFTSYDQRSGLLTDEVSVVYQRRAGQMVVGGPTGLTYMSDPPAPQRLADHPEHGRVMDIAEDDSGALWVALNWRGLARIDLHRDVEWFGPGNGLPDVVTSVAIHEGRVWVGTGAGLFVQEDTNRFSRLTGIPAVYVRRAVVDPSGGVYVTTGAEGVFHVREQKVTHFAHSSNPDANNTYAVCVDPRGTIWVGTRAGLFKLSDHGIVAVGSDDPTIDRPTYSLVMDARERLWCGTDRGVRVWDGEVLRAFSVEDGLIGAECNRAAAVCARDGTVWIGTERGLSVFDPRQDSQPASPPLVDIIGVDAGGQHFSMQENIEIEHDHNALTFDIRAVSFVDERAVRIRTKLEGLEHAWGAYAPLPARLVQFPYLPPGSYRLHAQALSVEGLSSAVSTSPWIVIKQPFWRGSWFMAAVVLAGCVLVFSVGMVVSKRRQAARLEMLVTQRTADLQQSRAIATTEKERLSVTLASIHEGVASTDQAGAIVMWNEAAEHLTGTAATAASGRSLLDLLPFEVDGGAQWLSDVLQGAVASVMGTCDAYVNQQGHTLVIEFSAAPLRVGHAVQGAVVAFRDVTARRRRDQDLATSERLNSLGVLAGGVAHDFNNLLTVVIGSLSMIDRSTTLPQDVRGPLDDARSASERARSLSQRLLTFARGGAPLRQTTMLNELVRHRVASFDWTDVRCSIDLPDDLWPVDIDPAQIAQVVNNLLLNACQAMPDGGEVRISGRNLETGPPLLRPGRYVSVRVADDGPGIPPSDIDRIFDPFYTTGAGHSGLGLSVAYSIAERHDGLLTVDAPSGSGATFEIILPASRSSITTPATEQSVETVARGTRLLLMDDHPAVRQVVSATLISLGFEVESAADGREAVEMYRRAYESDAPFAAVILDLTVRGGMGGDEATALLREIDPDVRAIAASGYAEDPIMANVTAYGFCDRLVKPFGAPELSEVLGRVLRPDR